MKTCHLFAFLGFALSASASPLPFIEPFESPSVTNGPIHGQNGWVLTSGSNATVQASIVATNSSQALEIQNSRVTHSLSTSETSVWINFQARITAAPETDPVIPNVNTSVAFFVNTSGNLVVFNGSSAIELQPMPVNVWTRFDIYCDYNAQKWCLLVNGTNVADQLGFYSPGAQLESLLIANDGSESIYIDSLRIEDENIAQLPFTETFETNDNITSGSINGQKGWVVTSGSATVQSAIVHSGSKALYAQNARISHDLSSSSLDIWHHFSILCSDTNPVSLPINENAPFIFYIDSDLNLVVYSNQTPVTLSSQIETNDWTRFDVYCDYSSQKWSLSVNGTNVAFGLPFYTNTPAIGSFNITGTGYIDLINIFDEEDSSITGDLDFDNDGLPDWWEQKHFGSLTNALPEDVAQNGLTYLQAYIAGLQPDDADDLLAITSETGRDLSWIRKPGRIYDVYWTPDLTTGFQLIVPDIQTDQFEDTDAGRILETAGFYQIRVRQ
jgi:hypothetical protein